MLMPRGAPSWTVQSGGTRSGQGSTRVSGRHWLLGEMKRRKSWYEMGMAWINAFTLQPTTVQHGVGRNPFMLLPRAVDRPW